MIKKPNILSRAISKLKQMEKQLMEESQVLDELKNKEKADRCELATLRSELSAKLAIISSLGEDRKKQALENEKLKADLRDAVGAKEELYNKTVETLKSETAAKEALSAALQEDLKRLEQENAGLSRELAAKAAEFRAVLERERADFRLNMEKLETGTAANENELSARIEELKESLRHKTQEASHKAAEAQALLDGQEALRKDLEKMEEENAGLSRELAAKAAEFRAALERERADFRLITEKLEAGAAANENELSGRIEELKESLRQKTQEASHKAAEAQALLNGQEALKEDYEARLRQLNGLNDSLKEDLKKQETENKTVSSEVRELNEAIKHLRHELARSSIEAEKATNEAAAVKTKMNEQDLFCKSAASALKEKEEDLNFLKAKLDDLSNELAKTGEDHSRRMGILRLELEEKKGLIAHLKRENEINTAKKNSLKDKLAELEKDRRKSEGQPK